MHCVNSNIWSFIHYLWLAAADSNHLTILHHLVIFSPFSRNYNLNYHGCKSKYELLSCGQRKWPLHCIVAIMPRPQLELQMINRRCFHNHGEGAFSWLKALSCLRHLRNWDADTIIRPSLRCLLRDCENRWIVCSTSLNPEFPDDHCDH